MLTAIAQHDELEAVICHGDPSEPRRDARQTQNVGGGGLAERVGITPANVSVLKNGRAKAIRFSTLDGICEALECQPGDVLEWVEE